jgi:hypothetical protein
MSYPSLGIWTAIRTMVSLLVVATHRSESEVDVRVP